MCITSCMLYSFFTMFLNNISTDMKVIIIAILHNKAGGTKKLGDLNYTDELIQTDHLPSIYWKLAESSIGEHLLIYLHGI